QARPLQLLAAGGESSDAASFPPAGEDRGADVARGIGAPQSAADLTNEIGRVGQVSDSSRGRRGFRRFVPVRARTCRRVAMKIFWPQTGRKLRICKPNAFSANLNRVEKRNSL